MTPRLVPFQHWHLSKFVNRETGVCDDWRMMLKQDGIAYTAIGDQYEILGCGGVMIPCVGVGVVWLSLSDAIVRHRLWFTRVVVTKLAEVVQSYGLQRLETYVRKDSERNQRWVTALGFKQDDEYIRYTMVK